MFDINAVYALIAGLGIACIASVMGCFVVWRRMAYFGDSLAHSALLGIVLGSVLGISTHAGIMIICAMFAFLLSWLQHKHILTADTLLGILSHTTLSIGVVSISVLGLNIDVHDYLFGDVMEVTLNQIYWIYAGGLVLLLLLYWNWSSLVLMTIHEDLALVENVSVVGMNGLLVFLITIVVAVSINMVGVLMITSLLIMPAAATRPFVESPISMAIVASAIGMLSVMIGVITAIQYHLPSGASIVIVLAIIFVVLLIFSHIFFRRIEL